MRILDRYIIKSFLVNYLLALGVLVGLFIVLDIVVNFDNFTSGASRVDPNASAMSVFLDIADFYGFQILVIFQQVSAAIPLLAAGFTMVRMTRHHELTAMLSSGVSLYRVAAPIVLVSVLFSVLHIVNQELILPHPYVVEKLLRKHNEVNVSSNKSDPVNFLREEDNSLILASRYDPATKTLYDLRIIKRDERGSPIGRIMAASATWKIAEGEVSEAWVMEKAIQVDDRLDADPTKRPTSKERSLLYRTSYTPAQLEILFSKKAVEYLSSARLHELINYSPDATRPMLYKMMHIRVTQPLMNIILLLIGIPFLLTREPNRLMVNIFYCMIVTGVVFAATFVIFQLGNKRVDPLLAAWLPVLLFGPVAAVTLDTIHT